MAALGDLAVDPSFGKCDMDMEEVLDKAPNCSICLEPVIQGASRSTAQLACSHHFHLDCIGSAFNAKGAMECPNCRRVEDGNWLMLGGSQSADDALYEVPYDFDDEEYLGMPVDALDTEMREYMEAGRDISYTTHPYHPHGVICEFCEQHYCDDNPCPHIIQCPYFFSNISQSGSTDNHFGSSISSMEAEAYAEAVAELYHEYRGPAAFSAPPSSTPRHAPPPEMHTSSSSTDSNYVYYFSSTPATGWQGGSTWGESDPPTSSWGSGWQQDRRQETTHTTTFVQSSTMITTYGPQAPPPAAASFPPPPRFPPAPLTFPSHSQNDSAAAPQGHSPPMLSPRTPLQTTPLFGNRHHSQPFPEVPPPPPENYASLRLASESNPHVNGEGVHTNPRPLTYAGVLGRREQPSRRGVNAPQERLAGQPWRPVSDGHTSSGGVSGRHSSLPHYHSSQAGHNMVCPYLANTGPARSSQGLVPPPFHSDASRMASQQGLSASGQLEDGRNARGGFENRHARQVVRGEGAQGAESLIAMLELDDRMWLQDRNNMLLCSFCSDQARPRFQTERRFVNRDALSQHMRAVHGVHLDRFSTRN